MLNWVRSAARVLTGLAQKFTPPLFHLILPPSSVDFPTRVARFPLFRPALVALLLISLLALAAHLAPAQTDTASAREPAAPPQQGNDNDNNDPPGGGNGGDPGESGGAGAATAGGQSDNGGATASGGATQADYSAFANAGQTTYPPGLEECSDLALEGYINEENGIWYVFYLVGNLADETLTNVKVEVQSAEPFQDGTTGNVFYTDDDGVTYRNAAFRTAHVSVISGMLWDVGAGNGRADRSDWGAHWLMPTMRPAAAHSVRTYLTFGTASNTVRIRRNTVTMAQLAPDGTALCKTERVYWTRSLADKISILNTSYGVALSADERYPAAGDAVNFKVRVNARDGYGVNARVEHTSGLTLASTPSAPASTTWTYSDAKRQGDFWIGTESVGIHKIQPTPIYEITLPMRVKSGAKASEQCVTVTVTGVPGVGARVFNQAGDDPSDNTETLCLGRPPLFHEDGDDVALWTVYPCVGTGATTHPCDNSDTLEVASVDNATGFILSAAPNKVNTVIKIDPVAGATVDTSWNSVHTYVTYDINGNEVWHQNSDKVSWVTKRTCPTDHHGNPNCGADHQNVPGVKIALSRAPFAGQLSDWDKWGLLGSVSGVGAGGLDSLPAQYGSSCAPSNTSALPTLQGGLPTLPTPPGGMMARYISDNSYLLNLSLPATNLHEPTYPRHKAVSNEDLGTDTDDMFAEFEKLGTYVVDYHASANRTSTATYKPGQTFCDTMRTVFHAGPIAELSVSDGGASPDVNSNQVAFTLNLSNAGPDESGPAKALVELPSGATSVTTIPANLGTFHSAGSAGGVSHGPYWLWNVGAIPTGDTQRILRRPQGKEVTLIVSGATAGDTATATVSNGNGHCEIGTTTLPFAIRTEDCAAINDDISNSTTTSTTTAEWNLDNPYKLCLDSSTAEVTPTPASKTACESTTGNSWHEGAILDHHQANNTTTLTARSGGAGLSGATGSETVTSAYLTLNWPAITDVAEYRVFRSTDGMADSYARIARVSAPATTYKDEAVTDGTKYYYLVEALYPGGRLAEIYTTSATATTKPRASLAPGSIRDLRAARQADDENTIEVTWRAPSNATAATRYDVQYRSRGYASSTYDGWATSSTEQTQTRYTFYNAGGGTSYQFRVRAVNLVGDDSHPGSWSGAATVRPVSNPDQVGNLKAARDADDLTRVNVSWEAPSGGTTPTGYELEYRVDGKAWTAPTDRTDTTTTSYQLTGAAAKSSYQFRARAVTITGGDTIYGSWRSSNTVARVAAPGQVGNLRATRQFDDETNIVVTWTAPNNATGLTRYEVSYQVDGGAWSATSTTDTTSTHEFSPAVGQSRYVFRVRGVTTLSTNERLEGSWRSSNTVSRVPTPGQVGSLRATRDATEDNKIKVTWTAPSNATGATRYDVERKEDNNDWTDRTSVSNTTTYQYSQASGAKRYVFRVRAVTESDGSDLTGNWRSSNTVPTLPAPNRVGNVNATRDAANENRIVVSWSAPSGGTTPTGYEVQYKENNAGDWLPDTPTDVTGTTTYAFTQANGGSRYQFQVRAYATLSGGAKLRGGWQSSNTVAGLPAGNIATTTATRSTSDPTTIDVVWTESARATVGYQVQHRKNNGGWTNATTTGPDARSYTKTGVGGVETHTFRVRGISGAGNGNWTVSNEVGPPPLGNHGYEFGVDWVTLKMTSGPWWYKYLSPDGWTSCAKVASGGHTILNLRAEWQYTLDIYGSAGCSPNQNHIARHNFTTLSDINNPDKCWNATDCRDIDNPNNFNNHTHKRQDLAALGVTISGCDWSTRVQHSHGWPDGYSGQHWHCRR